VSALWFGVVATQVALFCVLLVLTARLEHRVDLLRREQAALVLVSSRARAIAAEARR